MASARHNRTRKRRRNHSRFSALFKLLCLVALVVAATMGATVFFQVETVAVTGNQRYTQEEIIAASGVQVGDNLFRLNKYQIEQQIRQQLPYIGEITIRRGLPSTLTLEVQEWTAVARVEVYTPAPSPQAVEAPEEEEGRERAAMQAEAPWLISVTGRLLEPAGEGDETISVVGLTALAPQPGTELSVPLEQQVPLATLKELMGVLQEQGVLGDISRIDLTRSSRVELQYRENFRVLLPVGKDLSHSVRLMIAAVDHEISTHGEQVVGTMDLTQESHDAVFTPGSG